jgi:hypothetical protein
MKNNKAAGTGEAAFSCVKMKIGWSLYLSRALVNELQKNGYAMELRE